MLLLLPAIISLAGGLLVPLFRNRPFRNAWVLTITLLSSALLCWLCFARLGASLTLFQLTDLFTLSFRLDTVNRIFLLLIAFLWPLASLYAFEYMAHEVRESRFFCYYTLSYGVTQLLALSANLVTLYCFYECLTLVTLPLVTHQEDEISLRAGMAYLKFTVGGASLGLVGLIILAHFGASGSFAPGGLLEMTQAVGWENPLRLAFLLSFLGFASKAALFPFSFWLPRASVAPTPVTALLHAVAVVNGGVFACLRLTYDCFGPAMLRGSWAQWAVQLLSICTIFLGAILAVRERHLKRRLAWSTVYNLSYMLFSLSLLSPAGLAGALTHLVVHGVVKIILFFCAGAFLVRAKAEYLPSLRGIGRLMPLTAGAFALAGVALAGIPPFIGFLSKWQILNAAMADGSPLAWVGAVAILLSSVLACAYLLSPAIQMFFLPAEHRPGIHDPSWRMILPLALLCLGILLLGFWSSPFFALLDAASVLY